MKVGESDKINDIIYLWWWVFNFCCRFLGQFLIFYSKNIEAKSLLKYAICPEEVEHSCCIYRDAIREINFYIKSQKIATFESEIAQWLFSIDV